MVCPRAVSKRMGSRLEPGFSTAIAESGSAKSRVRTGSKVLITKDVLSDEHQMFKFGGGLGTRAEG